MVDGWSKAHWRRRQFDRTRARRWALRYMRGEASRAAKVASVFLRAGIVPRAQAMDRLLTAVGPLALAAIAGGAFRKYVVEARWSRISVPLEDAARASWKQVFELVRYVEQADPKVVAQVWGMLVRQVRGEPDAAPA